MTTRRYSRPPHLPLSRRSTLWAAGSATVGALALSSCSGHSGAGGASDVGGGAGGSDSSGAAESTPLPPTQKPVTALDQLTAVRVAGLRTADLSACRVSRAVSFPQIDGARGLSHAVDIAIGKILREARFAGTLDELRVTGDVVAASNEIAAVLLRITEGDDSSAALIAWVPVRDRAMMSTDFIDPAHFPAVSAAVQQQLTAVQAEGKASGVDPAALTEQLREQPRPWANGPTYLPTDERTLTLLFPAAPHTDGTWAPLELTLTDAPAEWLSATGMAFATAVSAPASGTTPPAEVSLPAPQVPQGTNAHHVQQQPDSVSPPQPARAYPGAGPRTQLAALAEPGIRPSSVCAPDAARLSAVALTFDDGPSEELNALLRRHLDADQAVATFFMIGQQVHASPALAAATTSDGHEVGSHSWSHPELTKMSAGRLIDEIHKPIAAISDAAKRFPFTMRPPYGDCNQRTNRAAGEAHESVHLWDVDTLDWKTLSTPATVEAVASQTLRGSIILMHEVHPTTVAAVPQVLAHLRCADFTLLTSSELNQNQDFAGVVYQRGLVTGVSAS